MAVSYPLGPIAALDIGTAKMSCVIARADANGQVRVLASASRASQGMRNGAIIDIDAAGHCAGAVVEKAEAEARESVEKVIVNLSSGNIRSKQQQSSITLGQRAIETQDLNQVIAQSRAETPTEGREVLHFLPLGYSVDGNRGIRDPRGLFGQTLAIETVAISCLDSSVRTLRTSIARAHLDARNIVASAFASGLAVLHQEERDLGITVIDMGAGSSNIGVFYEGEPIFCDRIPLGGAHVTQDIAQGLSTPVSYAERLKTLHGSCLSAASDDRDMLDIQPLGDDAEAMQAPRALLNQIIQARIEEILEMARARIDASPARRFSGGAAVLTGGASQLHGLRELAGQMLDKRVRIGRPSGIAGLADLSEDPAFATVVGLVLFAQRQTSGPNPFGNGSSRERTGMFSRMSGWLRGDR